jgi:hypothetical protein
MPIKVAASRAPAFLSRKAIALLLGLAILVCRQKGRDAPMTEYLASIIGALAAGAIAKAGDIGGRAVADAYDGLRTLIVHKLGKGRAVQNVEAEPRSETAQAALADALTKAGLGSDPELAQHAERGFVRRSRVPLEWVMRISRWATLSAR